MIYPKPFVEKLVTLTEYDAIAFCFKAIDNHQQNCTSSFVEEKISWLKRNGCHDLVNSLHDVEKELLGLAQIIDEADAGFEGFLGNAIVVLAGIKKSEFIELDALRVIGLVYLLHALDQYISSGIQSMYTFGEMHNGPLNNNINTGFLVYQREFTSIFSKSYESRETGFRKPHMPMELGSLFRSFFVLRKNRVAGGIPRIIPVVRHPVEGKGEKEELIIASIPFIGFRTILFQNLSDRDPLALNKKPSGSFYVDYSEELDNIAIPIVLKLLERAIDEQANIIILPEYIMSKKMIARIKTRLLQKNTSQLVLIFAGTTYEFDKTKKTGNNVLYILNGRGTQIGKYYKYSPFNTRKELQYHGTDNPHKSTNEEPFDPFDAIELLSDRGKECVILDVESWGRILPSICRDSIDGEYTDSLVRMFHPSFVMIPAWSTSMSSFDSCMKDNANRFHAATVLCNCCNAVESVAGTEVAVTSICMPKKKRSAMNSSVKKQFREPMCQSKCEYRGGCVIIYRINYEKTQPTVSERRVFVNDL